jgi:taurine dioxygenase
MTGTIGAEIEGIDLRDLDDAAFAAVKRTFLQYCVVVIRGQHLEPEPHVAFAARFGKLVMTPGTESSDPQNKQSTAAGLQGHPYVLRVRNTGKAFAYTENWHSDNCFSEHPTAISILAAQQIPAVGGDTVFSNQYVAYETLSDGMKRMLRGLRLKHTGAAQVVISDATGGVPAADLHRRYGGGSVATLAAKAAAEIPFAYHPVVRTHPETRRRALYIGGVPSIASPHFEGMTEQESHPLQRFLHEHSIQPDRCYRHRWQPGDVLMWDNRCTMHYAVHDYGDATREMNRVTVQGEVPFEAPYE